MAQAEAAERRRLTSQQLERIRAALFPSATGLAAWPLLGGIATDTYALTARGDGGTIGEAVARCYRGDWSHDDAAARVTSERATLDAIAPVLPLAPHVLLSDPSGDLIGAPLLVMNRMPGLPLPPPADAGPRAGWIGHFAQGLAAIHAIDIDRLPPGFRRETAAVAVLDRVERKAHDDPLSRELIAALHSSVQDLDERPPALIHDDYWFGNTLWREGELTGIVDWGSSRIGDLRQDIALARSDCALTCSLDAADEFLAAYERRAGVVGGLTFWDLLNALLAHRWMEEWLIGYHELGMDVSVGEARRRIVAFAEQTLRRSRSRWHVTR